MGKSLPVSYLRAEYEATCHSSLSYSFILCLPLPGITNSLAISDPATHTCPAVTQAFPPFQPRDSSPPTSSPVPHFSFTSQYIYQSTSTSSLVWCLLCHLSCSFLTLPPRHHLLLILVCFCLQNLNIGELF